MKRQGDWERDLKLAQPTNFSNSDTPKVSIGTVVNLESTNGAESITYTVLGAWDSDPDKGILAYLSDRGAEILDKAVGDQVEFTSAEGTTQAYKIASISAYNA